MNISITNLVIIINSIIFLIVPIVLIVNLTFKPQIKTYKKKQLTYVYGSIWLIAFLIYLIIFIQSLD